MAKQLDLQQSQTHAMIRAALAVGAAAIASGTTGCTKLLPNQFLLQQQLQSFKIQINTKVDLLWVVDNSSSMDPNQAKIRAGLAAFAQKYMQPTWDIRVAAIPSDAYLANPIFSNYLGSTIPQSAGAADPYIVPLVTHSPAEYIVPTNSANWSADETNVVNMSTGDYSSSGVTFNQLVPAWGPNYAKLGFQNGSSVTPVHDGPVAALCGSFLPYFLDTYPDCATRDSRATTGTTDCVNPSGSESGVSQCVNTVQNDTVHTGLPYISTMPPAGTAGDQSWVNGLIDNFMVNLTTGSSGHGSSREFASLEQFLSDNEAGGSPTAFFRPGSLRVIIFITDADDQSMNYTAADQSDSSYSPWTHYECDLSELDSLNSGNGRLPASFCCSGGSCTYGAEGTSCPSKTIQNSDGTSYTYTVTTCPNPSDLMDVASVKSQLDAFFENLDGDASNPNYFIVTITGLTGDSIRSIQSVHDTDDTAVDAPVQFTADRADRIIQLGDDVGNGSFSQDITDTDYSPILTGIGNEIVTQKGTFNLQYPATNQEEMIVSILHADGSSTIVRNSQYTVNGTSLTITDLNLVLSFQSTDQIEINYQPANSYSTNS